MNQRFLLNVRKSKQPPLTERKVKRTRFLLPTNFRYRQVFIPRKMRCRSLPYFFRYKLTAWRATQIMRSSKKSISPTGFAQKYVKRQGTLKLSLVLDQNQMEQDIDPPLPQKQARRRSCECADCGAMNNFQKQSLDYEHEIQQIQKEREAALKIYNRSVRKQQALAFQPYLNIGVECGMPQKTESSDMGVMSCEKEKEQFNLIKHTKTQQSCVTFNNLEVEIPFSPVKLKNKKNFFQSFLEKQIQIMKIEKYKLHQQKKQLNFKALFPQVQSNTTTPRSPRSFNANSPGRSESKRSTREIAIKTLYMQPKKSKFLKSTHAVNTLSDFAN